MTKFEKMKTGQINTKPFIKSKTLWFNLLLAAFVVLSEQIQLLREYLSDGGYLLVMILVAVVNAYLRTVTTQGLKRGIKHGL